MKKEIKVIDKKLGIIRLTTVDERWYIKPSEDKKSGVPEYKFSPSVTWISSYYPKGKYYERWLGGRIFEEAQAEMIKAGVKGSKVHYAAEVVLNGKEVTMKDKFMNTETEVEEELTLEEYECLMSLVDWGNKTNFDIRALELVGFNKEHGYAGTIDIICLIDGEVWLIDLKTSKNVWPSHKIQISAYSEMDIDIKALEIDPKLWKERRLGILQLGYTRNKIQKYKFTEVIPQMSLFLATKKIWHNECDGIEPKQKDYPLTLQIEKFKKVAKTKK